jgi:hypothetical protein
MLSRYTLRAFALAAFLPSVAMAAPIIPVVTADPTFRPVKVFFDGIDGTAGAAAIGAPFVPTNFGNDVSDLAVHGLTHPGSDPALSGATSLRSGANMMNGSVPGLTPVPGVCGPGSPVPCDYLDSLPPVGGLGPPVTDVGPTGLPLIGMFDVPIPAFAFGGTSTGPDVADALVFNFLIPGAAIEALLNADNVPGAVPCSATAPTCAGADGLIAIPGTFSNNIITLSLTAVDGYGGFEVLSDTLTGGIWAPGLGSTPQFSGGVPNPSDPNASPPLPFDYIDTAATDVNGFDLGSAAIGLNTVGGGSGTYQAGGFGLTAGAANLMIGCEPGAPVCHYMPAQGYTHLNAASPGSPLTALAASLAVPGSYGITTSTGGGGINLGPGLRAVPIGTINALGTVRVAALKLMSTNGDVGFAEIPEPSTALLLGAGMAGLLALRRRSKNA